jgi:hypothetical protein
MTLTPPVITDEQIDHIADHYEDACGRIRMDKVFEFSRAILALNNTAWTEMLARPVDKGHLFDLRYTLNVLHKVRGMISENDAAHQELGAAITGMRYVISRTESTTPVPAQAPAVAVPDGWRLEDTGPQIHLYETATGKWTAVQRDADSPALRMIHRFLRAPITAAQAGEGGGK